MDRPSVSHTRWSWEWRDGGERFHVWDFFTDQDQRGRGKGYRLLVKIVKWAAIEKDAEIFSIQMGGGAHSARWLQKVSQGEFEYLLQVKDVEGYNGDNWKDPNAERDDGKEDMEGDNHSSVYAVIDDLEGVAELNGWK